MKGIKECSKITLLIVLMCVTTVSVFCLQGCSSKPADRNDTRGNIAVILSNCFNFPTLTENTIWPLYDELLEYYYSSTYGNDNSISVVTLESMPQVCTTTISKLESGISNSKRRSESEQAVKTILRDAAMMKAASEELDMLEAINMAARSVNAGGSCGGKIIILANGISTCGVLDMTQGYMLGSADSVAGQLISSNSIEDLRGISVDWIGLGATASNGTQKITESNRHDLETFWTTLLERAGVENVSLKGNVITGECEMGLPHVSSVAFPNVLLDISEEPEQEADVIKLDTILFEGDSAAFLNEASALDSLKAAADFLMKNADSKYYLVGTTASIGDADTSPMSLMRAQACVDTLIAFGVNEAQITAIGLGSRNWSMRTVPDSEGYGLTDRQLEANRAANRAVYIIKAESETGIEIMEIMR